MQSYLSQKCFLLVLSIFSGLLINSATAEVTPPEPLLPIPSPEQLEWQRGELTIFIHFGVNTFTNREWGDGKEDPKIFNPTKLDARQWVKSAKAGGFKLVILTAKHHDGFCLWPSRYTDHSVKSSPWKDGQGDVVRELAEACREEGLKLGLYLSPWDRHEPSYGDSPKYNEYYRKQLTELLTEYGPITEVWFDGANGEGPNGKRQEYDWPAVHALVRELQPQALMFSDAGPDIRWIGNEKGIAGDPCWAIVDPAKVPYPGISGKEVIRSLQHGDMDGTVWRPGESDVSIRPGWFWHPEEDGKVRSVENLVDLYFKSVGRNSLLLLNIPPNKDGLLAETDVQRLAEFKQALDSIFAENLAAGRKASASAVRGQDEAYGPEQVLDEKDETYWALDDGQIQGWIEVDLGQPVEFNVACLKENIALGQRVISYRIEVFEDGDWRTLVQGSTIGHKKLDRFPPARAQRVRVLIDEARACPTISEFGLYRSDLAVSE